MVEVRWCREVAATAAILISAFAMACGSEQVSVDPRPTGTLGDIHGLAERGDLNVLFIVVDTLRADRLGSYGHDRDTSPHIDGLAATGVRFARQVAQSSWTKCSMSSMWTGLYPARTGVLRSDQALSDEAELPAEIFRDAGFRTAAIWRNGWIAPKFGFDQGFELYHSPRAGPQSPELNSNPAFVAATDADTIRSASAFLRAHGRERWFLYLHLMDVHQYVSDPSSTLFGNSYSDIYDNSIRWVDSLIGHLLTDLDRQGLREKTLIVFTADHGEAFGEHNNEGHARNVYGEVTETPFIVSFPFRLDPGITVTALSENVDLWPTILDLLGLPELEDPDGRSLRPLIEVAFRRETDEAADENPALAFAHLDQAWARPEIDANPMVAVTEGSWRLIYRDAQPSLLELFDKANDPEERRNLAPKHPELAEALASRASDYLSEAVPPWGSEAPVVEINDMEIEQLRAIGYGR